MKNLMIDIETMGTHSSSSLILSVGALPFDLTEKVPVFGDAIFLKVLSLESQLLNGRRIERGTQDWWKQQTPAARSHWESASDRLNPAYLQPELANFLTANCEGPNTLIWANGIVFDLGNLENLFGQHGGLAPWKYNVVRDARTAYQLKKLRTMPDSLVFEGHDPIEDCRKQIWRLWEHAPEEWLLAN